MFPFEAYSLALLFAFSSWTSCPFSCIFEVFFRGLLYVTSVFEVFIRGLLRFTSIGRVLHFTPIYIRSLFQRSLARHLCWESLALHSRLYLKSFSEVSCTSPLSGESCTSLPFVFKVFFRGLLHVTSVGRVLHFTPIYIRSLIRGL